MDNQFCDSMSFVVSSIYRTRRATVTNDIGCAFLMTEDDPILCTCYLPSPLCFSFIMFQFGHILATHSCTPVRIRRMTNENPA